MKRKGRDYKGEYEQVKDDAEIMEARRAASREHYARNLEKERARSKARYASNKEYYKKLRAVWWKTHPEKAREYAAKKVALHPERERERVRKWHQENSGWVKEYRTQKRNGPQREQILKVMRYGAHRHYLTREKYEEIYPRLLTGPCDICGAMERCHIDHCHEKMVYRGILCDRCNRGIGFLRDNPELLRRAAEYLEKPVACVNNS